jgi:hypothetical protein
MTSAPYQLATFLAASPIQGIVPGLNCCRCCARSNTRGAAPDAAEALNPGLRALFGSFGNVAGHSLLAGLELLDAGLEPLDLLPHAREIARHRLEQLRGVGRQGGGGRRDAFRCGLSRSCRLRRYYVRVGRLNDRWARLLRGARVFQQRR